MPVNLRGQQYYRTMEVCRLIGISRSTLLRWISDGILDDTYLRDRRGWRLFTEADIKRVEDEAHKIK